MSDDGHVNERRTELRRLATLREYEFTSDAPGVGTLVARLRDVWNRVATRWHVRPIMEQQSAFNTALADWLDRRPGTAGLGAALADNDRRQTRVNREIGLTSAWARRLTEDRRASGSPAGRRLRVAYISPLPPARSGIADYSADLLPHLTRLAEVTVFAAEHEVTLPAGVSPRPLGELESRRSEFDVLLYQMGNSSHHEAMYELLLRFPGVVVLHDYMIHHFIHYHTAGRDNWIGYERELAYALGDEGRRLARAIRVGETGAPLFDLPLNERVVDSALGLIVHSRYAAERIRRYRPEIPLTVVPAQIRPHPGRSRRAELGLADDAVLFGSFGQITAEKRIDLALRSFNRLRDAQLNARYLLVGEARPDADIPALIAALDLEEQIHHIGYVADLAEFLDYIHTADVVVSLRLPTVGETSAIALRAMAAGRPLIVFDHGWYSELPDAAAVKVPPGDEEALRAAMARLASSADLRESMGQAGREYVRQYCLPQRVADAYLDFLRAVLTPPGSAHA